MVLAAIKKYPNQISTAFKRFPTASAFTFLIFITLVIETNNGSFTAKADKIRWLFKRGGTILPSSFFRIHKNGNEWILKGKGFGHGVGLCQMGARARAQAGQSYIQILTHYYPGITLEKFKR